MMEDRRYRSRSPVKGFRLRERDYEDDYRCLPRGREYRDGRGFDRVRVDGRRYSPVVGGDGGREFERMRRCSPAVRDGREYERMRVDDRGYSPAVKDDREYGRIRVDHRRCSPSVRDCREDRCGRECERIRVDDRRYSPEFGDGEYERTRVGDRRYPPVVGRDGREDRSGREYDRMMGGDRRCSSVEVGRGGREDRCGSGGGEYERMRVGDRRYSPVEVGRDGKEDGGGEYERMRVGDWRYSHVVVRDGKEDRGGGREYDRMGVDDRWHSPGGRVVEGVRDGSDDRRPSPGRSEVEGGREDDCGGGEYDRMRGGDRNRSPRGRVVEGVRNGREDSGGVGGGECDMLRAGDLKYSPRGGEVDRVRDGRGDRGDGRDCDRMRVDNRRHSPRGRELEVGRDGREYQKGMFDHGEYSMGGREMSATWSAGQHERQIVHPRNQREMKVCVGDEYEERIAENKYSPMQREMEGMRNGKEYGGSRMLGQESPMFPLAESGLMDEHIPEQVRLRRGYDRAPPDVANRLRDYDRVPPDVANRGRDYGRAPLDVANRGRGYDRAPPDVANSGRDYDRAPPDVANRARDYDRAPPDVANRARDYDRAPPDVANRGRDYDRAPPDVANSGRDYDRAPSDVANRGRYYNRAPPDVANSGRDYDGALPWSMVVSRDDIRKERDNGSNNGLLENNCYQFDDSLPSMGSTPLKFQNNLLDERWKADTFRSNRESSARDARLCNDGDNFNKQLLNVGLLERFCDTDRMLSNSDNGSRFVPSCPSDSIVLSKQFGVTFRGHSLTPPLGNADHKHVDLHGDRYLNKLTGDGPFTEDRNSLKLLEDEYDYIPSSSLSKAFSTMSAAGYGEEFPSLVKETDNIGSEGAVLSCGISGKPHMYDRHGKKSPLGSSIIYGRQSNDSRCYSHSYITLPEEHKSSGHQEVSRSEDNQICSGSCDISGNSCNLVQNYCFQDMSRTHDLELNMDREKYQFSKQDRSSDGSQQWDLGPYSIRHSSHLKKQDMDILDYGDSRLQYDIRINDDLGPNQHSEDHDHRKDDGSDCHHARSEIMRSGKYYPNLDGRDRSPTQTLFLHNLDSPQPSEMMLPHRHLTGNVQSAHQTNGEVYVKEPYGDYELDFFSVSKKSKCRSSRYEKTGNGCRDLSSELTNRNLSQRLATVLSKDTRSSGRDIKSRLGPSPQNAPASRSVAKKLKSSVKKRLGQGPNTNHVTLPWIKNLSAHKLSRIKTDSDKNHDRGEEIMEGNESSRIVDPNFKEPKLSKIQQDSEGSIDKGENSLEANEIFRKCEPLENSEEFRQLVHSHFFKFVKQLNETLVRRRKFMENGKCGSLKCFVCGSDSPEFQDTQSLVMHALSCDKIGYKCQHLGFHKALCTLMGWRSADVLNHPWVCERLSDAETSALKDDLIIWPPVVVVHNITIADIPERQITLSVLEFEGKLRDMGFGDKTKVSLGRPANQGTMVVSFGPTFSAFLEAERLHKIFLDFNRGRTGVLQLNSNSSEHYPGELSVALGDELHPFLYGYIGLAGDLDKLDFEIKRRSLIKSKMEIQVVEDALVKKEVTADATNKKEAIAEATVN